MDGRGLQWMGGVRMGWTENTTDVNLSNNQTILTSKYVPSKQKVRS